MRTGAWSRQAREILGLASGGKSGPLRDLADEHRTVLVRFRVAHVSRLRADARFRSGTSKSHPRVRAGATSALVNGAVTRYGAADTVAPM
jgi:hypothetical protein